MTGDIGNWLAKVDMPT